MSRNLENEMKWRKDNYMRLEVTLDKETGNKFKEYLKKNNTNFSEWCKNMISNELENDV